MAPEVFMQSGNYDEKADVYNYGLCIWELFAEKIPFEDLPSGNFWIFNSHFFFPLLLIHFFFFFFFFLLFIAAAAAEMAYNGTRPLLCSTWSEDLCHLIDSCWQIDPVDRLSFPQIVDILQTQRQSLQQTSNLIEETDNVNKLEMMFSTTNRKITKLNTRVFLFLLIFIALFYLFNKTKNNLKNSISQGAFVLFLIPIMFKLQVN